MTHSYRIPDGLLHSRRLEIYFLRAGNRDCRSRPIGRTGRRHFGRQTPFALGKFSYQRIVALRFLPRSGPEGALHKRCLSLRLPHRA